jgi:hypothetical protein
MRCTRVRSPGARTSTEPELPAAPEKGTPVDREEGAWRTGGSPRRRSPPRWRRSAWDSGPRAMLRNGRCASNPSSCGSWKWTASSPTCASTPAPATSRSPCACGSRTGAGFQGTTWPCWGSGRAGGGAATPADGLRRPEALHRRTVLNGGPGHSPAALSTASPIWTALSAAPLRRLSATDQNSTALGSARSPRMRPTNTPSVPTSSSGVG